MASGRTPMRHAPVGGLCDEDHWCPSCEAGNPQACADLFRHPTCGLVACATRQTTPVATEQGAQDFTWEWGTRLPDGREIPVSSEQEARNILSGNPIRRRISEWEDAPDV